MHAPQNALTILLASAVAAGLRQLAICLILQEIQEILLIPWPRMRGFFARVGHDVAATLLVGLKTVSRVLLMVLGCCSPREDLARPSLEFAPVVPAKTAQDWAQVDWSTRPQRLLPVRLAL